MLYALYEDGVWGDNFGGVAAVVGGSRRWIEVES